MTDSIFPCSLEFIIFISIQSLI